MPVLFEGAQVPAHLTNIPISLISTSTDSANKYVKGKVIHKGPLVVSAADNFILKTVIQEDDSSQKPSINIVLFGDLAKSFSQSVNQGDVVVASGFQVGKSPTVRKDNHHACNLLLSKSDACIYVYHPQSPSDSKSPQASKRSSTCSAEVSQTTKAPKYTYVRLDNLKLSSTVNVYGVVVFFKLPHKSRGTHWCSTLKITDQSNLKIQCTLFCNKREDHPQIFQVGDIVRLHRVKTQSYEESIQLISAYGFAAVTFDGIVGRAVEPRTSSRSFQFHQEDQQKVEELRAWAASHSIVSATSTTIPLSATQPKAYFDLTCQLLAKAPIDTTCTLLRVWDGSQCPHTLLKVIVEPDSVEGPVSFSENKENLIANVLVYDNHVEFARQLKPGTFLRIFNLRAIPGSSRVPGLTSSQAVEHDHLAFHLHGGTSYGRGIQVLPENSQDVQELKSALEMFSKDKDDSGVSDSELMDIWCTPPETLERRCIHNIETVMLSQLKQCNDPLGSHHVRVQLSSFKPHRLHQALKLYCSKCSSLQDVPDDEVVNRVFSEASRNAELCSPPSWALSGKVNLPGISHGSSNRTLHIHSSSELLSEGKAKELIYIMGSSLEETCRLADGYQNIIPVRSSEGRLALLDWPAPFLFRGRKRYYGCKSCSEAAAVSEPSCEGVDVIDEKVIAEALQVQPLQFVLLMELQLQDATDTLDVFLWKHAEMFFNVSAEDVAANQEAQDHISRTMNALCPKGGSDVHRPWLDMCLTAYSTVCDGGRGQTCYQICDTGIIKPRPPPSESYPSGSGPTPHEAA
uniref:Protection of telomeres protein 1 n=1 Tax=Gouania willdenowi TaxID=441366 RepID=A0A8C5HC73_GOUWI